MKKKIFTITCAVLLSIGTLVVGIWASNHSVDTTCQSLDIVLCDSAQQQFVSVKELQRSLKQSGLLPLGEAMSEVSCQTIEEHLLKHDMVRTAQCYKTTDGGIQVKVTQRVPMLMVRTSDGSYYVDTDRKIMPNRSSIQVQVPVLKGQVNPQMATTEYYDFVQWLNDNAYWQSRITQVYVQNPHHIVLTQREVEGSIILGKLQDYETKMNRLKKLYVEGLDHIGYKPYKEYDLRYDGQVIGRYK